MIRKYVDIKYKFIEMFDDSTGSYIRSGIIKDGKDTGVDPFMRSFPALIDIGIVGHCAHAKFCPVGCYQGGENNCKPNMTFENFKKITDECRGKVTQFALGGHGDPDCHENFEDILKYSRENEIIPNFTTSGFVFGSKKAELCKEYCGAVAVSWYRHNWTTMTILELLKAGVTTNIHYVLSKSSIDEAIDILNGKVGIPRYHDNEVNAIVFLLHKPVGKGSRDDMLDTNDPKLMKFFEAVENNKSGLKIGFDSCTIPGIINFTKSIDPNSTDTCEGGRFSMYITPDMYALPCSFDNQNMKFAYNLDGHTIKDAWNSSQFNEFRSSLANSCPGCPDRSNCMGGCPLMRDIVLCNRGTKNLA